MDFIEVSAQNAPTTVAACLRTLCPGMRMQRVLASPTAQGRSPALARIIAGGCRYLILSPKRKRGMSERVGWFRRCPPRVVIVTHIVLGAILALGRVLRRPVRYVLLGVIAGKKRPGVFGVLREWFYRVTIRRAELVLCYSRRECDLYASRFGVPRAKFHAVPCKVNISPQWRPGRPDRTLDLPRPYIASAGRTNRDYATLAKSCENQPWPVIVATDLILGEDLPANMFVRSDLFWGDYLQFLADSAFVVVPLKHSDESSGQMVMLEAMLLGKAVIVTRTTTTIEYGRNEETCVFVPPDDPEALAAAIERLQHDEKLVARLGEAGRAYARRRHSSQAFAEAILAAIEGVWAQ